jgi:deoxyribonuclease-4
MPRTASKSASKSSSETDILKLIEAPENPPAAGARRIGIHTSTAGGVESSAERAWRMGCNALQIFTSSPRQWRAAPVTAEQSALMRERLQKYDLDPLVSHANYLINVAGANEEFHGKSVDAFRGEIERAIALGAKYLVLHPGSFKGLTREEGLDKAVEALQRSANGIDLAAGGLTVLMENTAGAEFSLGSGFEHVATLIERLKPHMPVAACIDTCHCHAHGYDLVSEEGYEKTLQELASTVGLDAVRVVHCNDAKAPLGSKLDRHEQIGEGTMGLEPFRRLLHDKRLAHAAFIAETPIVAPLDDLKNVQTLRRLAE